MRITLPSRRIVIVFLIVLFAGGVFVMKPSILGNKTSFIQGEKEIRNKTQTITQLDADSDGDGLKDWEEKLIGTNPYAIDTDGDGVIDSAEEAAGNLPSPSRTAAKESVRKINATERLTQDLLNQYVRSLQYDDPSKAPRTSYSLKNYSDIGYNIYDTESLTVGSDDSDRAVRAYAASMGGAMIKHNVPDGNELNIVSESISSEDEERIKELDPIIARYEALIDEFLNTEVPPSLVEIHLDLLNSYTVMLESVETLRGFYTDPVGAILGFDALPKSAQAFLAALAKSEAYFENRNISFSNNEPGYALTYALRDARQLTAP